jgi:hypothetical protein
LQYAKDNSLPLDFFSWHTYCTSINALKQYAHYVRDTLDKYGFYDTITILDEWNGFEWVNLWGSILDDDRAKYEAFTSASGETGAAFTASALISMLDLPIDIATIYDGQPTNIFCTVFDRYGVPTKQYYAFDAFNKLKQTGGRIQTECETDGMYAAAAVSGDGKKISVLIANNDMPNGFYQYEFTGLDPDAQYICEIYSTDKHRTFEKTEDKTCAGADIEKSVYMYRHSFALICLSVIE